MSILTSGLGAVGSILHAQQTAIEITQRNIANANTSGYTRQRVSIRPASSDIRDTLAFPIVSVETFRNRFIDLRVSREVQGQGQYEAATGALDQVEALLNENSGSGLEKSISDFFNGLDSLANAPEDLNLRQMVLSKAGLMAREFQRLRDRLSAVQLQQDTAVAETVDEINSITATIAGLNARVAAASVGGLGEKELLLDQRQVALERLAELIDVSYYETEAGSLTVTSGSGLPLVLGDSSNTLSAERSALDGLYRVRLGESDITSRIESGKLGGLVQARDGMIAGYLEHLDNLAATLIEQVNVQHALGTDLNGLPGGSFFTPFTQPVPGSNQGAAGAVSLAFSDPRLIAAAALGAGPGSNANARALSDLRDQAFAGTQNLSLTQYYSRLVYQVGSDSRLARDDLATQGHLLIQLQNQRDSLTGVNLDEEAVNILRYQKAYEASARIIQVWDELSDEIVHLLGA